MGENKQPTVYQVVRNFIFTLDKQKEKKNISGILAVLRNSLGRSYEEASVVWPIIIPFIPDEFIGSSAPTYEEKSIYNTLQLYALGQQGSSKVENDMDIRNMGVSLGALRADDSISLDKRFNAMINSSSYDDYFQHLKHLFKLGKAKGNFRVNYPKLADDLFWYQMGENKQVRLGWARGYYRIRPKNADSEDKSTEE